MRRWPAGCPLVDEPLAYPLSAICQHTCLGMPCTARRRLDPLVPMSWDNAVRSRVLESSALWPHSLHTAEVTGSIPVTPTSTNASRPRPSGSFARRFARRSRVGRGQSRLAWRVRALASQPNGWALVPPRPLQLAALEAPIALVRLGWGCRFRHLEDERQSVVDRLDDPGGHLRGWCVGSGPGCLRLPARSRSCAEDHAVREAADARDRFGRGGWRSGRGDESRGARGSFVYQGHAVPAAGAGKDDGVRVGIGGS
jgi:hypothetical protein